jgi:hypothetical protein
MAVGWPVVELAGAGVGGAPACPQRQNKANALTRYSSHLTFNNTLPGRLPVAPAHHVGSFCRGSDAIGIKDLLIAIIQVSTGSSAVRM